MRWELEWIFKWFSPYNIGIVGSATKDYDLAHDVDVLFFEQDQFKRACESQEVKWNSWDSGTGLIMRANTKIKGLDKPIQLLWAGSAQVPTDHPYMIILWDDPPLNEGKWYEKPSEGYDKAVTVDRRKEKKMVVAIDFDGTIRDWTTSKPIAGAKNLINLLREKKVKVIIHSCNNPKFIEQWCRDYDIRFDKIWTDADGGKPVAQLYIDDLGFHATGDYEKDTPAILARLGL